MRLLDSMPLLVNQRSSLAGYIGVQHAPESGLRGVFAGLTGRDDTSSIASRQQRFQVDPGFSAALLSLWKRNLRALLCSHGTSEYNRLGGT